MTTTNSALVRWKEAVWHLLRSSRLFPHIYFYNNPFRIVEYGNLVRGLCGNSQDVVLDLGCGHGLLTLLFGCKAARIVGLDPDPSAVQFAKAGHQKYASAIPAEFKVGTLADTVFQENTFNKVFSVCVLEHIPDHLGTLGAIYRILKPGGVISFSCDSLETIDDEDLRKSHGEQHKVLHYFTALSLRKDLESVGFREVKVYSLFRSRYAAKLFKFCISHTFMLPHARAILLSWSLRWMDLFSSGDKGLFLIAKAVKPAE